MQQFAAGPGRLSLHSLHFAVLLLLPVQVLQMFKAQKKQYYLFEYALQQQHRYGVNAQQ